MLYYLDYKGEQLPISLSFKTLSEFQSITKASWNEIDEKIELYPVLFEIALKNGFHKLPKAMPYNKEQVIEILDDLFFEFQALVVNEFVQDVQKKMAPKAKA